MNRKFDEGWHHVFDGAKLEHSFLEVAALKNS